MKAKQKLKAVISNAKKALDEMEYQVNNIPVNLIAEMFPQGYWQKNWNDVQFLLPMSFELIEQFKTAIADQFPEFVIKYDNQFVWSQGNGSAGRFLTYSKPDSNNKWGRIIFEVAFRSEIVGSTCVLNPVGKELKEVVTYEVVCSQEAANEF